ncbi:MAG TPA: hypothetical protein P5544_01765 [Candidatus Nanopelagicales bacterium]|nr:hypothetical protein [Candidatus Nanopelagicales bacterium]
MPNLSGQNGYLSGHRVHVNMADDPVVTNPRLYSVIFENDRVRVLHYRDEPGDRTLPHRHPDSVMVCLSSFVRRLEHGDEHVDVTLQAGDVRWLDAQEHSGRNVGVTPTETIFVELKEPAAESHEPRLGPS